MREVGYYWTKTKKQDGNRNWSYDKNAEWEIAYWNGKQWQMMYEDFYEEEWIQEVHDQQIIKPD